MTTILISVHEDRAAELQEVADKNGMTLEELAARLVESVDVANLASATDEDRVATDEEFQKALRRIMAKNVELRRRLA